MHNFLGLTAQEWAGIAVTFSIAFAALGWLIGRLNRMINQYGKLQTLDQYMKSHALDHEDVVGKLMSLDNRINNSDAFHRTIEERMDGLQNVLNRMIFNGKDKKP